MSSVRGVRLLLVALVLMGLASSRASAQAWVPAQGEGTVSFMYQDQFFKYHLFGTTQVDAGPITSRSMLMDVTYGLTDKVALSLALPVVWTKYTGPSPHPLVDQSGPNPIDLGSWNTSAQDFRFDVRYNVTRNLGNMGIVLTPFFGSIMPSHDYPYFAHAGFGRDLRELQLGTSVAKLFEHGVPGLLLQGRYSYGFVEEVVNVPHNRSFASLEVGYFATPSIRLLALSTGQITHGGIDLTPTLRATQPWDVFVHHDQIQRENMFNLGGGASYALSDRFDVFGSYMRSVYQRNGHVLDHGVSVGVSWSFTTAHAKNRATGATAENSLAKCLCEKGK
jgi:opacity protein-like surface antigen